MLSAGQDGLPAFLKKPSCSLLRASQQAAAHSDQALSQCAGLILWQTSVILSCMQPFPLLQSYRPVWTPLLML